MKKLLKLRLIANLLVVIIVMTSYGLVSAQEEPFKDVVNYYPFNSWAKESIMSVANTGIINGKGAYILCD